MAFAINIRKGIKMLILSLLNSFIRSRYSIETAAYLFGLGMNGSAYQKLRLLTFKKFIVLKG